MKHPSWGLLIFLIIGYSIQVNATDIISSAQAHAATLQSDGKLLVAGSVQVKSAHKIVLSRYKGDGSFDRSFGTQGMAVTAIGSDSHATGLHAHESQIYVCGYAQISNMTHAVIARYTSAGVLDTTFADAGIFTYMNGNGCTYNACSQQSDGSIICVGSAVIDGMSQILLVKLTSTGALDINFGTNGVVLLEVGLGASAQTVYISDTDEIFIGGYARRWNAWQPLLIKFNYQGVLDTAFGTAGLAWIEVGIDAGIRDMARDADNMFTATGFIDDQLLLVRITSQGSLDTSFGDQGVVQKVWGTTAEGAGIALLSDGSMAVIVSSDANALVAKYSHAGLLDTNFGDNGCVVLTASQPADLVVQTDDKIVAAAFDDTDIIVARYLTNGNLDMQWGTLGLVNDPGGISTTVPVFITDTKSIGSNGGTFTAGSWQVRDLTTISSVNNSITISQNQIVIQPGSYTLRITAPAYRVGLHQVRLYNVTDNQPMAYGASAIASTSGSITFSTLETNITVTKVTVLQVEHRCTSTQEYDGFGIAGGFGDEVYTTVKITRI